MRNSLILAAVLALSAGGALAQGNTPPAATGPQNSAINGSDSSNRQVGNPVKGHNSFTAGEAKSRIERRGFSRVTGLKKDDNGVWRGRAEKNGRQVDVSLDYQGNVVMGNGQGSTGTPMRDTAGR